MKYGEGTEEEYLAALAASSREVDLEESLREDYTIGIDENGNFLVGYSGTCTDCGFKFSFHHEVAV